MGTFGYVQRQNGNGRGVRGGKWKWKRAVVEESELRYGSLVVVEESEMTKMKKKNVYI